MLWICLYANMKVNTIWLHSAVVIGLEALEKTSGNGTQEILIPNTGWFNQIFSLSFWFYSNSIKMCYYCKNAAHRTFIRTWFDSLNGNSVRHTISYRLHSDANNYFKHLICIEALLIIIHRLYDDDKGSIQFKRFS